MREQAGFDMILLDLDGTLIDSEKGIVIPSFTPWKSLE